MHKVTWTDTALVEAQAIVDYVLLFDELAGRKLAERLRTAAESLSEFPRRNREVKTGLYKSSFVFPYLIKYRIEDDEVVVISVRHGARDEEGLG